MEKFDRSWMTKGKKKHGMKYTEKCHIVVLAVLLLLLPKIVMMVAAALSSSVSSMNGHYFYYQKAVKPSSRQQRRRRPLVLVPGFGQSISSYQSHVPYLSQQQDVLIYQPYYDRNDHDALGKNVSLPAQAERLIQTVDRVFFSTSTSRGAFVDGDNDNDDDDDDDKKVNLAGFSLGGRIALCAACLYPDRIDRLHLTGVAHEPSTFAQVNYRAWKHLLLQDNLQGVAWSSILASYHPHNLQTQPQSRLNMWVESLCQSHTSPGLLSLLEQTHREEWSVVNMAQDYRHYHHNHHTKESKVHLCVGRDDRMATVNSVLELAKTLLGKDEEEGQEEEKEDPSLAVSIVEECGHAVPMEAPRLWRQSILQFLEVQ